MSCRSCCYTFSVPLVSRTWRTAVAALGQPCVPATVSRPWSVAVSWWPTKCRQLVAELQLAGRPLDMRRTSAHL